MCTASASDEPCKQGLLYVEARSLGKDVLLVDTDSKIVLRFRTNGKVQCYENEHYVNMLITPPFRGYRFSTVDEALRPQIEKVIAKFKEAEDLSRSATDLARNLLSAIQTPALKLVPA